MNCRNTSQGPFQAQSISYLPHPMAARVGFRLKPTTPAQIETIARHIAEFSVAGVRRIARMPRGRRYEAGKYEVRKYEVL